MNNMNEEEKAVWRRAYGIESTPSAPPAQSTNDSEGLRIAQKFENIWDLMLSRTGTIDKLMDKLGD